MSAVLAVTGMDFGWGSAGKISAILAATRRSVRDLQVVMLGTTLGRPVLADVQVAAWYEHWPRNSGQMATLLGTTEYRLAVSKVGI